MTVKMMFSWGDINAFIQRLQEDTGRVFTSGDRVLMQNFSCDAVQFLQQAL